MTVRDRQDVESAASDRELLGRFARGEEGAFTELVGRHLGWVRGAAERQVGDREMAEDVTQVVFVLLARKAKGLGKRENVGPWLFKVTRYTCLAAMRAERRRARHEREVAVMRARDGEQAEAAVDWEGVKGEIDGVVAGLRGKEREAVVLRVYEQKTFAEVGRAMGISEEAARKRVERGLEKVRAKLGRRGVGVASVAVLVGLMASETARAAAVPAAEVGKVAGVAVKGVGMKVALAEAVTRGMRVRKWKTWGAGVGGVVVAAGVLVGAAVEMRGTPGEAKLAEGRGRAAVKAAAIGTGWYPIAKGWPVAVAGSVTSTPGLVDLDGDGRPEVVVTCMARRGDPGYVHPRPSRAALVYAFHADGKAVAGFPVEVVDAQTHDREGKDDLYVEAWFSSPSAIPGNGKDKRERIAVTTPFGRGLCIIDGEGKVTHYKGGNQWNPCPVADVGRDGVYDIVMGNQLTNVDGGPVAGWPAERRWRGKGVDGFAPCIGDARGDGGLESYVLTYGAEVAGYDETGKLLAGWPRKVGEPGWFAPVMGTIVKGEKTKQVVGAYRDRIYAWMWDGRPVPGADAEGVLVRGVEGETASPTLVDLDGDGVAEIVVYDQGRQAVRAWHGDGTPVGDRPDRIIAVPQVPDTKGTGALMGVPWAGVSAVTGLSGEGNVDLFCGVFWIRFEVASQEVVRHDKMVPVPMEMNWGQPVVADLRGDGKAEVIMGLRDGRVIVYETGLKFDAKSVQWGTCNGSFQHTGVWESAGRMRAINGEGGGS